MTFRSDEEMHAYVDLVTSVVSATLHDDPRVQHISRRELDRQIELSVCQGVLDRMRIAAWLEQTTGSVH